MKIPKLIYLFLVIMFTMMSPGEVTAISGENACTKEGEHNTRRTFLEIYERGDFANAEQMLSLYYKRCGWPRYPDRRSTIDEIESFYWVKNDLMLAKQGIGKINDCLEIGITTLQEWPNYFSLVRDPELIASIKKNLALCEQIREETLGAFEQTPCQISAHPDAIAIPKSWGLTPEEGLCLYWHQGDGVSSFGDVPADKDLKSVVDHPRVVLIKKSRNKKGYSEEKLELEDGELASGELCGGSGLSLGGNANAHLIRIGGSVSYCWPGTASIVIDVVYTLSSDKRVQVYDELLVPVH
ncbi:hypothetical protein U14_02132 [Candidatus Moduliflexus flocculans]|uniref:Uncharacterized protein n=1 Tax=Candidatus Moduliflexus flocculans TaxID=1499966 RepID=A0A0S6VTL6_9BACT|nr:hypothetical protein U14_02132 [Candidatus Moduliflexus flocculans]